jgi:putative membrane protein
MKIRTLVFAAALALPMSAVAQSPTPNTPTTPSTDKTKTPSTDKTKTPANDKTAAKLSDDEVKIVAHLHHVNVMEIDMGKDAKAKATAAVKRYGEMMIKDHTTADKELAAMAKKKGVAKIPAAQPMTEAEKAEMKKQHEDMMALKKMKGADYDKEYLRQMVDGHEKELAKSDVFISTAQDTDLKTALEARKTLLQRHADAAKELQKGNAQASVAPTEPAKTSK